MTEHIDGLYTVMDGTCADILDQGEISSGYGSGGPADPSLKDKYFINPKLIAPINLIKWED